MPSFLLGSTAWHPGGRVGKLSFSNLPTSSRVISRPAKSPEEQIVLYTILTSGLFAGLLKKEQFCCREDVIAWTASANVCNRGTYSRAEDRLHNCDSVAGPLGFPSTRYERSDDEGVSGPVKPLCLLVFLREAEMPLGIIHPQPVVLRNGPTG